MSGSLNEIQKTEVRCAVITWRMMLSDKQKRPDDLTRSRARARLFVEQMNHIADKYDLHDAGYMHLMIYRIIGGKSLSDAYFWQSFDSSRFGAFAKALEDMIHA